MHLLKLSRRAIVPFAALILYGCATPTYVLVGGGVAFPGVEPALETQARLYIFRPRFATTGSADRPVLSVGRRQVAVLGVNEYVALVVAPGEQRVSLEPGAAETTVWNAETRLTLQAGDIAFLAVWNVVDAEPGPAYVQVDRGYLAPIPINVIKNSGVRFEMVSQADALLELPNMRSAREVARNW